MLMTANYVIKMHALIMPKYRQMIGWRPRYFGRSVCINSPAWYTLCAHPSPDHIFNYMHPQAILVDGSSDEETFFSRGAQQHANAKKNTLIELPRKSTKRLEWLTKLDSQALRSKAVRFLLALSTAN